MAEEDIISSLPEHLLLEIISRIKIVDKGKQEERLMSTKEVIKTTTTISKRWRHLWTLLPTLVFLDEDVMTDRGYYFTDEDVTNYFLFIRKALAQCPSDVNLKKFKLQIKGYDQPKMQVNSWIHYTITRNVQEIDLRITNTRSGKSCDDELFFNNSCFVSMDVSCLVFNPPNGIIRWDKLKFLRIDEGRLDEDLIRKILSGSPCLENLELSYCNLGGLIPKSLFGNFGILEGLSCHLETYRRFSDELFLDNSYPIFMSIKLSRCVFNPPTGGIRFDKLKFLCINRGELDEDIIGYILSESPFLETLQLHYCYGFIRIDVTSTSLKNLVLFGYRQRPWRGDYIDTLEINAPYISSLTIEGEMNLEEILLQDVSSLIKADLNYWVDKFFKDKLRRDRYVVEEKLLRGLLSSLGHVNEIALGVLYNCLEALSRLEAAGFQFRKGSYLRGIYPYDYLVFSLNQK